MTSKRERKNNAANSAASVAARLPPYPLGMTQRWKIFISCKPVLVLRKQVFWVVPHVWVIAFRRFEGMYRLRLQGCDSLSWREGEHWTTTWYKAQMTFPILLRVNFFVITLSSLFIVFCWCMVDCLWKNERIKVVEVFGPQNPWIYNNCNFKHLTENCNIVQYYNVGTQDF